ncbi:MAG: hypothetical protein KIT84_40625 [Labilithrix sp.]|nr:hypothetical protein [Labilithrix sp.]MCW5817374.1 hypothetical protein [Labilithrix sp.]
MPHVVELVASWIVTTTLTFLVIIVDERRVLSESQLERAWPPSSRDAAVIAFGPLAIPFHFMRTRGGFRGLRDVLGIFLGLALGVVALVLVVVVTSFVLTALFWALGLPEPPE